MSASSPMKEVNNWPTNLAWNSSRRQQKRILTSRYLPYFQIKQKMIFSDHISLTSGRFRTFGGHYLRQNVRESRQRSKHGEFI